MKEMEKGRETYENVRIPEELQQKVSQAVESSRMKRSGEEGSAAFCCVQPEQRPYLQRR